ncbi:precorrin-2 dehydrogenase/sirohydrochlorin ferrochelatase family protein [Paenibacillus koleovorans]|uniref:precorrin-2 dehydrogenase/sirohydrochlorin ferrochelatase family protein n=1 Tax=Paenibacillus koleovorans TaxID=121608 RepID=UPI0013E3F01D|nr:NAD(P)-dependent oxidoreductase [Paenibacillus koleovorans]
MERTGEKKAAAAMPLLVQLEGRRCLVVGGGRVAERKIAALLPTGARVTVVSPAISERIAGWLAAGELAGAALRGYEPSDGEDAFLVVAATDRPDVNARVCEDARARGQLVNAAERPELGNVTWPAVLRRGRLTVAVSTAGASPAAAVAIRDRIDALLGAEAERLLEFLEAFRREALERVADAERRGALLRELLSGDVFARQQTETGDGEGDSAVSGFEAYVAQMRRRLELAAAERPEQE